MISKAFVLFIFLRRKNAQLELLEARIDDYFAMSRNYKKDHISPPSSLLVQ